MTTYLIRRSIEGFFVLVAASFMIYSILTAAPGGPLDQLKFGTGGSGRPPLSEDDVNRLKALYKLDTPWPLNYVRWLFDPKETTTIDENYNIVPKGIDISIGSINFRGSGVINGDLGKTMYIEKGRNVTDVLGGRLAQTLILMSLALGLSLLVAFPIGIISAIKQYSKLDYAVTTFSFFGLSMPTFWLGLMLIIFFAVLPRQWHDINGVSWMPYLPTGGIADVGMDQDIPNRIYHLILPIAVLA